MEQCGHCRDGSSHSEPANAIEYVCSHTPALVRCTVLLRKLLIPSGPLLHQCRGKRASQAEDQTEEPQHVDPEGGSCWFEWLTALRCNAWERYPVRDIDELYRSLSKESIGRIARIGR